MLITRAGNCAMHVAYELKIKQARKLFLIYCLSIKIKTITINCNTNPIGNKVECEKHKSEGIQYNDYVNFFFPCHLFTIYLLVPCK